MRVTGPGDLPRRKLEDAEVVRAFGLEWLELTVLRQAGVSKRTGEVRYRALTTRYRLDRPRPGVFELTRDDGTVYVVSMGRCSCEDEQFKGRRRI